MGATDIVAEFDGNVYRVQVKSSQLKEKATNKNNYGYQFIVSKGGKKEPFTPYDCDVIACVALDTENVWFFPVHKICRQLSKRIHPKRFDEHTTKRTWKDTIAYLETLQRP